jgi:hypothetical protein
VSQDRRTRRTSRLPAPQAAARRLRLPRHQPSAVRRLRLPRHRPSAAFACRASAPPAAGRQGQPPPHLSAAPSPPDSLTPTPTPTDTPASPSNSSSPVSSALLCFAGTGKPDTREYPPGAGTGRVFYPRAHLRAGKGRRCGYARRRVNVLPAHTRPAAIPISTNEFSELSTLPRHRLTWRCSPHVARRTARQFTRRPRLLHPAPNPPPPPCLPVLSTSPLHRRHLAFPLPSRLPTDATSTFSIKPRLLSATPPQDAGNAPPPPPYHVDDTLRTCSS